MRRLIFAGCWFLVFAVVPASAEVQVKAVEYRDGDTQLRGYFAWDDAIEGRRPGVIVVHEWWGLDDYARRRAEMLARLGYVAFAVDMYGEGRVTEHASEAKAWMKQIASNVEQWQRRAMLGVDILRKHEFVDPTRVAAIGYCFGGATVMQMAYSGADLKGVASFHGSLPVPTDAQAEAIRSSVMVAHGNADEFVPAERVAAFMAAMEKSNVDWQMTFYGGALHAFTVPGAEKRGIPNLAYNERADHRSWEQLQAFLKEVFEQTP